MPNKNVLQHLFKQQTLILSSFIIAIYVIAGIIQHALLLNYDVGWLIEAANRLLSGGTYTADFFENNPPLILYLYTPAIFFAKIFSINIVLSLRIYIFLLATLSLYLCSQFATRIFLKQDAALKSVFLISTAFLFLILPIFDFGQREHLLIIFSLPYLLMITYRLQGNKIHPNFAAAIGLFAGLGFAIKPYFLMTFALIELYYIIHQKNIFAWMRAEVFTIINLLLIYAVSIYIFQPDYLFIVLPFALRWCYASVKVAWPTVFTHAPALFCLIVIIFSLIQQKKSSYRILNSVLMIGILGFLFSYLVQQTLFFYHILPAFSLSILLSILLFTSSLSEPNKTIRDYALTALLIILLSLFLQHKTPSWALLVLWPIPFYSFFACLFLVTLWLKSSAQNSSRLLILSGQVILVIGTGILFSDFLLTTTWYEHRFFLTVSFLITIFVLLTSGKHKNKLNYLFTVLLGASLFSFPSYFLIYLYKISHEYKRSMEKLTGFAQTHPEYKSAAFFYTSINPLATIGYNNIAYGLRFSGFWMLGALVKQAQLPMNAVQYQQYIEDKNFLITMIAEDLNKYKPDLVFVDASIYKNHLMYIKRNRYRYDVENIPFNYITYFSTNKNFSNAWKNYRYLTSIEYDSTTPKKQIYKFDIYARRT